MEFLAFVAIVCLIALAVAYFALHQKAKAVATTPLPPKTATVAAPSKGSPVSLISTISADVKSATSSLDVYVASKVAEAVAEERKLAAEATAVAEADVAELKSAVAALIAKFAPKPVDEAPVAAVEQGVAGTST